MLQKTFTNINTPSLIIVGMVVILFFIIFFYLLIIQLYRRRILHQKEMVDMQTRYEQTILQSQLEIQESTFKNIAQEIHDNIGQVLSLAKLNLGTISNHEQQEKIELTEELLAKAIGDLRDISKSLHTDKISNIGLLAAIKHELQIVQRTTKLSTELITDDQDIYIEGEKALVVFRMIQESLHNIIKHAKAKNVVIEIRRKSAATEITITDDGRGFDITKLNEADTGIGLKSIQQRAALINCNYSINSTPGFGTVVKLVVNIG